MVVCKKHRFYFLVKVREITSLASLTPLKYKFPATRIHVGYKKIYNNCFSLPHFKLVQFRGRHSISAVHCRSKMWLLKILYINVRYTHPKQSKLPMNILGCHSWKVLPEHSALRILPLWQHDELFQPL